jgi:hypothetical protein
VNGQHSSEVAGWETLSVRGLLILLAADARGSMERKKLASFMVTVLSVCECRKADGMWVNNSESYNRGRLFYI